MLLASLSFNDFVTQVSSHNTTELRNHIDQLCYSIVNTVNVLIKQCGIPSYKYSQHFVGEYM